MNTSFVMGARNCLVFRASSPRLVMFHVNVTGASVGDSFFPTAASQAVTSCPRISSSATTFSTDEAR
jgi:hypothetical protein